MTPELLQIAREERDAEAIRRSLVSWCRLGPATMLGQMRPYGWQVHFGAGLRSLAEWASKPGIKPVRIVLVEAPQQTGKTEIGIRRYMSWLAAQHSLSLGLVCATTALARDHSMATRRYLRSDVALRAWPHLARPKSTDARDTGGQWTVPHRDPARPDCVHLAVGRRGSLEGRPLDGVVLDDLYQSVADAASPANQRQVEDLLTTSVLGRVSSRGGFILDVGTRRGKRDTKGFWLRKADELRAAGLQVQIERWSYPLRGDEPWRYPGGYIVPTWDAQTEQATRILMGSAMARILLDCEDVDAVGDVFDLDLHLSHFYEIAPSRMAQLCGTTYLSIDTAETAGGGDWTVIQRWGKRNGLHHLLGQRRGQWDTIGVVREINAAITEWKPQAAYIEATSAGKTALAVLGKAVQGCALVPVEASGSGSKLDRIRGILPLCALGQVLFPSPSCGEDVTWCYGLDAAGLDLRTRLGALRGDRPDMRGEVDDEADAMQIYLRHAVTTPASAYPSRGQVNDMISRLRGGR